MRAIRSDNGSEFKNARFDDFCRGFGLDHQYSSPYVTPQNGMVERKNRTLVEMARTMLDEYRTPRRLWAEAINTACYVANRIFLRSFMKKTSYELRFGRQPRVSHLRAFSCRCFVLKEVNLDKFESRSSDGILLGYALESRGYRVLILETNRIVKTCNVTFDESTSSLSASVECAGDDEFGQDIFEDEDEPEAFENDGGVPASAAGPLPGESSSDDDAGPLPTASTSWGPIEQVTQASPAAPEEEATSTREAPRHIQRRHPPQQMLGDLNKRTTRSNVTSIVGFAHSAFVDSFETKDIGHALSDSNWVNAMHEELENFERNQVWVLVEPPPDCHPIGTKWVFKNKQGEDGMVVRNKARLVAQYY